MEPIVLRLSDFEIAYRQKIVMAVGSEPNQRLKRSCQELSKIALVVKGTVAKAKGAYVGAAVIITRLTGS